MSHVIHVFHIAPDIFLLKETPERQGDQEKGTKARGNGTNQNQARSHQLVIMKKKEEGTLALNEMYGYMDVFQGDLIKIVGVDDQVARLRHLPRAVAV